MSLPLVRASTDPVATHCPYCSLQCGMTVTPRAEADGGGFEVAGANFPTNRGGLCEKGLSAAELLSHPDRLTTPLVRDARNEPFREATWDEALDRVAAGFTVAQERYGPDAAGLFGGGGLTNEKAYQAGKFVRVALRSASVDYNGRFCMSSAAAASSRAFGIDRGHAVPAGRHRPRRHGHARRLQPGRHHAAGDALVRRRTRARRHGTSSSTRATPPPPRRPTCTSSRSPAPTWRSRTGCCTSRSSTGWSTRPTSPTAPPAGTRSAGRRASTGRTAWSGSPACRCASWSARSACSPSPAPR